MLGDVSPLAGALGSEAELYRELHSFAGILCDFLLFFVLPLRELASP